MERRNSLLTGRNLEQDQADQAAESQLGKGGEGEGDRTERIKLKLNRLQEIRYCFYS